MSSSVEMSETSANVAASLISSLELCQKSPNVSDTDTSLKQSEEKTSPPRIPECALPPPLPPDPPFGTKKRPMTVRVDGVDVPLRENVDRARRRTATKSGVTEEARKVLEQFLKHSYSRGMTSPYTSEQNTQSEREYVDECPYMLLQSNESYYKGHQATKGTAFSSKDKETYFDEPDYAEPAEPEQEKEQDEEEEEEEEEFEQIPETQEDIDAALSHASVTKANSVSSQSSFGMSLRSHPASRSPSERFFCSVHPQIKGKIKAKSKKHKGLYEESSSSTEDYEYTESYLVQRKKKSFFKWASERLRQSFRRSHNNKLPGMLSGGELSKGSTLVAFPLTEEFDESIKAKKTKKTNNKLKFSLKRCGSDKGSKSTHSSSTPNETNGENQSAPLELGTASEGELASYCVHEEQGFTFERSTSVGRRKKSPVPWKRCEIKTKKKSIPPFEATKDRNIFDSFLRHIRKGSSKLKKKGSKGDSVHQRSCSADNLILRPLSKEHEKLLQRYTRHKEPEYDSDNTTTHSFHEVAIHRVDQAGSLSPKLGVVWYPLPLPPEPAHSDDGDVHSLQQVESMTPSLRLDFSHCTPTDKSEQDTIQRVRPSESEDDVDGKHILRKPSKKLPKLNIVRKPFHERSELEKEELYEKIAEQLAAIADQYNLESPRSSKSISSPTSHSQTHSRSHSNSVPSQSEAEDSTAVNTHKPDGADGKQLEEQLGLLLKDKEGLSCDVLPQTFQDVPPFMAELVRNASYSKFKQIFNENIGTELGWQQIAMMFRLTQTAVQLAGFGTAAALQIKEMTLKYFEDKFAGWIVGQGGWESVVEDTENESELD